MTIDPHGEPEQQNQYIELDEAPPTGMAEWLTATIAVGTTVGRGCLGPLRRTSPVRRARAVLGGVVLAAVTAAGVATTTVVASIGDADSMVDVPIAISAPPMTTGEPRPGQPVVTGSTADCGPGTIEAAIATAGPRPLRPVTGVAAIAAFEAAYYHARDGGLAREVVAAQAAVSDASTIQAGIDSAPPGTTYCARIQILTSGLYSVEITETRPGAPPTVWRQRISTTQLDWHSVITAIVSE
ncbi:hypothetical protein [Nocardia sp. NPDC059195]|uniref:hypothetical protein n=1 Tax=Nocardia sp. NPDC059195 TaxID=3346765 RepID=UPI0036817639